MHPNQQYVDKYLDRKLIGLFMSKRNLAGGWPAIGRFIIAHDAAGRRP